MLKTKISWFIIFFFDSDSHGANEHTSVDQTVPGILSTKPPFDVIIKV